MLRVIAALIAGLLLCAQTPMLPGFPPGTFQSRAALDAGASGCADANVIAWKSAVVGAGGTVSGARETTICTLVGSLKSHSCFATYDRLWIYAAENAQSAQFDLAAASAHTLSGTPTFTTDRGYQQNTTAQYIDTNYNLSTGTNFLQNSASISVYVQTSRASSGNFTAYGVNDAASTGNQTTLHPLLGGSIFWGVNNSGNAFDSAAASNAQGFFTINRSAASGAGADDIYKNSNSTAIGTGTTASATRPNLNMFIMGQNLNGTNSAPSAIGDRIAAFAIGGSVGNGTAIAQCQTDINTYMTAVGANVY